MVIPWVARPRPSFEPIIPGDRSAGIADELNRMAEGLDGAFKTATVKAMGPTRLPAASPSKKGDRPVYLGVPTIDDLEGKLMAELDEALDRSARGEGDGNPHRASDAREEKRPAFHCAYTKSAVAPPARSPAGPSVPDIVPPRLVRVWDGIDRPAEVATDRASTLNRLADGIEIREREATSPPARALVFEPIDPDAARLASPADDLNRASDGVSSIMVARDVKVGLERTSRSGSGEPTSPARSSTDVARAMQLTRDALRAWRDLMTGSAVVQVSSR